MRYLTILVIITIIAIFFNKFFFGEKTERNIPKKINKSIEDEYSQYWNPYFADVWVALSVNVWTKKNLLKNKKETEIYENLMDLEYMLNHKEIVKDEIINKNIELLNEYISLLETDITELLDNSINREDVYNAYITQLKYKWKQIKVHIENLKKQQANLQEAVNTQALELANLKKSIKESLKDLNKYWATAWINKYLDLKYKYNYWKTYLYLITKFLDNFNNLQAYNRKKIRELESIKANLISWEAVVLEKSNEKILKKYGLLIEDIK